MDLVSLLVAVVVFGIIAWLVLYVIPMPPPFKTAATVILSLILIVWLLQAVGFAHLPLRR